MLIAPQFTDQNRTPGLCSFCGSGPGKETPTSPISPDRHVVITELDIDFEGSVEMCLNCAEEAGGLSGMVTVKEAERLKSELAHARSKQIPAESERDAARRALDAALEKPPAPAKAPAPAKKAAATKKAAPAA